MNLILTRSSDDGVRTFGTITAGFLTLQTLERPWIPDGSPGGHPMTSCVPAGDYTLALHDTLAHPRTFALVNYDLGVYHEPADVPKSVVGARTACLIHSANIVEQLAGCIGLGLSRSSLNGEPDIASSRQALDEFLSTVPWCAGHVLSID